MGKRSVSWFALLALFAAASGCTHWSAVTPEEVKAKETVQVILRSGISVQGEALVNNGSYLLVRDQSGRAYRLSKEDIVALKRKAAVYDAGGSPISEREIAARKGHRQLFLHALGGTALSFGLSFYAGSMLQRGLQEDQTDNTVRIATTVIGTTVGGIYFAFKGDKRDRQLAIQEIQQERLSATAEELEAEKARKAQVEAELERLRQEQEAQERELEALRKQIEAQKGGKPRPPR